jgi:hypothetical protein
MYRFTFRKAALLGAALAAVVSPARAEDGCCAPPPCAPAAPQFRTVYTTECVPETYQTKQVVMVPQTRVERYTAYRCESVPVVREQTVTVYNRVCQVVPQTRTVCVNVPSVETRTVMKPCWTTQQVTTYTTKCVDRGHYECREVHSHRAAMRNRAHQHRHRNDCCPPPCPPPTKTVKVWVPCMVQIQCPVTRCQRVCTMVPSTVHVTVCRQVTRQETINVTVWRCVPEQRVCRVTVMTTRQVPYEATRCVTVCVPTERLVTCTRMVARTVARQVPVSACDTCGVGAAQLCCGGKAKQHGLGGRLRGGRGHHGASGCCY